MKDNFLEKAIKYFGWQGGTIHQVYDEIVKRTTDMVNRSSHILLNSLGEPVDARKYMRKIILSDIYNTEI